MQAYLGLGSNVGDRLSNLQAAVNFLDLRVGGVKRVSRVYETAPMYMEDQPAFYNAVVEVETYLGPEALLTRVKEIEAEVGRVARVRHGPREIDIDLLALIDSEGSVRHASAELELPHPGIAGRRFVLEPLSELAPALEVQPGLTAEEALAAVQSQNVQVKEDAFLSVHSD